MTHKPRHSGSTPGAYGPPGRNYPVSKPSVNPYKQAAQSMMSVGIGSVSGSTTSDDKGKKAEQIQKEYKRDIQEKDKGNGLVSKKDKIPSIILKKKIPTRFDKRKLKKKKSKTSTSIFKPSLEPKTSTSTFKPSLEPGLLSPTKQDIDIGYSFSPQDETFMERVENWIYPNIPEQYHSTIGASLAIATAAVEQGYTYNVNEALSITADWEEDMLIRLNILLGD